MHRRLNDSDIAFAYECYCEGVPWEWIAKELGMPRTALIQRVHYAIKHGAGRRKYCEFKAGII